MKNNFYTLSLKLNGINFIFHLGNKSSFLLCIEVIKVKIFKIIQQSILYLPI